MKTKLNLMIVLLFIFGITACGNKGDLYVPQEPQPTEPQKNDKTEN